MKQQEVIDMFLKNELKPNQVFVKYLDPAPHMRVAYIELRVSESGDALTCIWYDRKRYIVTSRWKLWKENLISDGFQNIRKDWTASWLTHEEIFE